MTFEIGFLFALLAAMVYLFLTAKLPVDLAEVVLYEDDEVLALGQRAELEGLSRQPDFVIEDVGSDAGTLREYPWA